MPVLEYHLQRGAHADDALERLLLESSRLYAATLRSPVERVRVFAHLHDPRHAAIGGRLAAAGAPPAPYFTFIVLEGRPLEECQALLAGFTELCVRVLGVARADVRGRCVPVPPQHWAIGGEPASVRRAAEIAARVTGRAGPG